MNVSASATSLCVIPLPAEVQLEGAGSLPVAEELSVLYEQDSFRPIAEQLCGWIHQRCGVACTASRCDPTGGNSSGRTDDNSGAPLLLHRVRLSLHHSLATAPASIGADAEAYSLVVSAPCPQEVRISATALPGICRGAGAITVSKCLMLVIPQSGTTYQGRS